MPARARNCGPRRAPSCPCRRAQSAGMGPCAAEWGPLRSAGNAGCGGGGGMPSQRLLTSSSLAPGVLGGARRFTIVGRKCRLRRPCWGMAVLPTQRAAPLSADGSTGRLHQPHRRLRKPRGRHRRPHAPPASWAAPPSHKRLTGGPTGRIGGSTDAVDGSAHAVDGSAIWAVPPSPCEVPPTPWVLHHEQGKPPGVAPTWKKSNPNPPTSAPVRSKSGHESWIPGRHRPISAEVCPTSTPSGWLVRHRGRPHRPQRRLR